MVTDEEIQKILGRGEDNENIFLASSEKRTPLIQAVTALCNAPRPGTIWLGVLPDGTVRGLAAEITRAGSRAALEDALDKMLFNSIVPPSLDFAFEWIDLPDVPPILAVQVWQGPQIPYRVDGTLWVRSNSQTRAASPEEAASLEKRGKFLRRRYLLGERALPALQTLLSLCGWGILVFFVLLVLLLAYGSPRVLYGLADENTMAFPTFSPDGKLLAIQVCKAYAHCWIEVIDAHTGASQLRIERSAENWKAASAVWLPDGSALLIADETNNMVWHYTLATAKWFALTHCPQGLHPEDRLAIRPQGDVAVMVCAGDLPRQVFWFEVSTERAMLAQPLEIWQVYPNVTQLVFSPNGDYLVGKGWSNNDAESDLLRMNWQDHAWTLWHAGGTSDDYPVFSPDGRILYVASRSKVSDWIVMAWDVQQVNVPKRYIATALRDLAIAPDGHSMVALQKRQKILFAARLYPQWLLENETFTSWRYGAYLFYEFSFFNK